MPKSKYKFNPDSLSFDKVTLKARDILLKFLSFFVGSLLIAVLYYLVFAIFFNSPKEKVLIREIEQLALQYEIIQRDMGNMEKVIVQLQETDDNLYRTIFEAEPIPVTLREGGVGGVNRYKELEGFSNSSIVIETARKLDKLRKQIYIQSRSFDELITLSRKKGEDRKSVV